MFRTLAFAIVPVFISVLVSLDAHSSEPTDKSLPSTIENLPSDAVARLGSLRFKHGCRIRRIAYSPDGKLIASCGGPIVRLWAADTGKEVGCLVGHKQGVDCLCFAPDGKSLASCAGENFRDSPNEVVLWDLASRKEVRRFVGHKGECWSLTFSRDGKSLVTGGYDQTIRLWDVSTGNEHTQLKGHAHAVRALDISADGSAVVSAADDMACMWDVANGKVSRRYGEHYDGCTDLAIASNGTELAISRWNKPIELREIASGRLIRTFKGFHEYIFRIAISPDGKLLVGAGKDTAIYLWDLRTGKELRRFPTTVGRVESIRFSPDSKTIAAAIGCSIRLWNCTSGGELFPFDGPHDLVNSLKFSPDEWTLASAGDTSVFLWDAVNAKLGRRLYGESGIDEVAFSPDGSLVAGWGGQQSVAIWKTSSGENWGRPLQLGSIIARVWDDPLWAWKRSITEFAEGEELRSIRFTWSKGHTIHTAVTTEGRCAASTSQYMGSSDIDLWDLKPRKQRAGLSTGITFPNMLLFSRDGEHLAVAGHQGEIEIWEVNKRNLIRKLAAKDRAVSAMRFSPDGRMLAVGNGDGTLALWEIATGDERQRFAGHRGGVVSIAFTSDGRRMASGSADTTIVIWALAGETDASKETALSSEALDQMWNHLGSKDAAKAYQAMRTLAGYPRSSLRYLRKQLRLHCEADPQLVRFLTELDSDKYVLREKATTELERAGERAEPLLRQALAGKPSAELARRIELQLKQMDEAKPTPDRLRAMRVIETISLMGDDGTKLLKEAAVWSPVPWIMREATLSIGQSDKASDFKERHR